MSDRLTIRLGSLAEPIRAAADAAGQSRIEWARSALAKAARAKYEPLPAGNPAIASLADQRHSKRQIAEIRKLWPKVPASQQSNIVWEVGGDSGADTPAKRLNEVVKALKHWTHPNRRREITELVRSVAGTSEPSDAAK